MARSFRPAQALRAAFPLFLGALLVAGAPDAAPRKTERGTAAQGKDGRAGDSKGEKKTGKKGDKKGKKKRKKGRGSQPDVEPKKHTPSLPLLSTVILCPDDMVKVAGRVCVDRYEATLVDAASGNLLSPFYPPAPKLAVGLFDTWQKSRADEPEDTLAHEMPIPDLPELHRVPFRAKAMSWPGSTPAGYTSGEMARDACAAAGKRLCTLPEWVTACRGEKQTIYPYGMKYVQDACNVFREEHPAHLLHGAFSTGLLDPRLNQMEFDGRPLLSVTGGFARCASPWGEDAVMDLVGNVDEWVEDPEGTFVGGFYSRATRNGCDARVSSHAVSYFDYSIGARCCLDPGKP